METVFHKLFYLVFFKLGNNSEAISTHLGQNLLLGRLMTLLSKFNERSTSSFVIINKNVFHFDWFGWLTNDKFAKLLKNKCVQKLACYQPKALKVWKSFALCLLSFSRYYESTHTSLIKDVFPFILVYCTAFVFNRRKHINVSHLVCFYSWLAEPYFCIEIGGFKSF